MAGKGSVLVTGGGGYVGSHVVLCLLEAGHAVVALDNFVNCAGARTAGQRKEPESLVRVQELTGKQVAFYGVDLMDKEALRVPFREHKIVAVMHFAALKAVGESMAQPLKYYQNNLQGACNLMEVMQESGCKRLVFSSTSCVYGDPKHLPVDESHPTGGCANPYGRSKFFCEEVMRDVSRADPSFGVSLLRYFNPVGAHPSGRIGEDPRGEPANLMPFVSQVAVGRRPKLKVFGGDYDTEDGTGVRDYIHVMDLAEGHVAALDEVLRRDGGVEAYNLGTGEGTSVLQLVSAFEKATGAKVPLEIVDRRPGDVACAYASADKAERELRWKARRSLVDMCSDTWKWQSQNPGGFAH